MNGIERRLPGIPLLLVLLGLAAASAAEAFCGFYVAKGDEQLFNHASKVVVARDGDRTVVTMASDFRGDPTEFAVVVPVPVVLARGQIHIGDSTAVDHLDKYSVPRLVEYWDSNPCPTPGIDVRGQVKTSIRKKDSSTRGGDSANLLSIRIEARYKVDEYDILILSATEGRSLGAWLRSNGYRTPPGAESVLASYIRQGMFFFVAKVDLKEQRRLGFSYIRPIQVAFESPKFMLPIRLGMVNADGTQDMLVFTLTRRGRVETTNYRSVRLPTDLDVPEYLKGDFPAFCEAMFRHQWATEGQGVVFLEYAWGILPNVQACDPCSAPVLRPDMLRGLGATWIAADGSGSEGAFLTRLHVRYDARHFPEDLQFQETSDRTLYQVRYAIHHPYRGPEECPERADYLRTVRDRRSQEASNAAALTGDALQAVRQRMGVDDDWAEPGESLHWWERIWKQ
ncbi:MAG TPA: DUF2330 domain-containing protein [Candidatus Eisenbacteria bacterium]